MENINFLTAKASNRSMTLSISVRRLILVGYRGTGKSTVGRQLAETLEWGFSDCDEELERQAGRSVAEIFALEGEAGFRERETQILRHLCQLDRQVLATGGGAVVRETNRQLLRHAGWVVWLRTQPETILQRLQADPSTIVRRPALTTLDSLTEIRTLLAQRSPLYASVADQVIDTDHLSPSEVVAAILSACKGGS